MLRLVLPLILALAGVGGGIAAGLSLAPEHTEELNSQTDMGPDATEEVSEIKESDSIPSDAHEESDVEESNFVRLNNQFIIPVLTAGRVTSLVVMSLSLEVGSDISEEIFRVEPKLRDVFLRVLFDHANTGGFDGAFTESAALVPLRMALRESAQKTLGPVVQDVLILDIVRQDTQG